MIRVCLRLLAALPALLAVLYIGSATLQAQLPALPGFAFNPGTNAFTYDDPDDPGPIVTGFLRIPSTVNGHAIMICHGKGGSAANFNSQHAPEFLASGFVCILPEFTHTGAGSPSGGVDEGYSPENSRRGRACLKILAATPGVDPARVAMFGHSMGAYFMGGFAGENPAPLPPIRAAVEGAGGAQGAGGSATNALPTAGEVAGITAPMLLFHGTGDPSYPSSQTLQSSLSAHAVPNKLLLYQGVPHGILDANQKRSDAYAISRAWFTQHGVLSFPGNTAPTVMAPAAVTVTAGATSAPLAITVGDAETGAGSLTVQAFSLDSDVVASTNPPVAAYSGRLQNNQLQLGGSGANRTLTLAPSAGKSGTVEVALVVTDSTTAAGQLAAVTYLSVTINNGGGGGSFVFGSSQGGTSLAGQNGTAFSATLTATGATAPVTWSLTAGALPTGVTLGSNGTFSGTPTQSGTFNFTVQATDAASATGTQAYTLTVVNPPGAVNHRPTISWIPDLRVAPGASVPQQSFTIGDDQTPVASLTIARGSTNQTLLPVGGIVVSGSGANRTVMLSPTAGQTGRATVFLTVMDGGGKTSVSAFTLNVASAVAGNTAPLIQGVPNETIVTGTSYGAVTLVVKDTESAENTLTLTAASSNPTLVPTSAIVFGPSNPAQQSWGRTVSVTPVNGQTGRAVITLNVSDGPNTASTAFVLDVVAGNTAPSIADLPTFHAQNIGTTPQPVSFTLIDTETTSGDLLVTATSSNTALVPNNGVALGGIGASRTVTLNPVAGQRGAATITLAVSDGDIIRRAQFLYVVTDPAAPSEQFAKSRGVFILDGQGGTNYPTSFGQTVGLRDSNLNGIATKTHVDGFTLRVLWNEVEGGLGEYDFFVIQNALNKLPADKKLSIIVVSGSPASPGEPSYIANTPGVATWMDGITPRAVPWDPFLRARRHALVEAMASFIADGAPLRDNPRLVILDPYLPGGTTGMRDPNAINLSAMSGYTRQKLLETVQDDLRLFQDNFPGKRVQIGFFPVNDGENASYSGKSASVWLREQLLAEFNGILRPRIGFFMELLAAKRSSPNIDPYAATPITSFASPMFAARDEAWGSFQMLGSWTNPFNDGHVNNTINGSPADAMEYAYNTYNSEYTEVYIGDINNAAFRPMLQSWHDFLATRPAIDGAPTISGLANQTLALNSPTGPLAFTVGDAETSASGLAVSAQSSNPALVPVASIVLAGTDANRTVTVTPASGVSGTATITLSVFDGVLTTQSAFVVTVIAPPAITSPTAAGGIFGSLFNYTITATNNPTSFNATGLPPGLAIATATGEISGTPTATGSFAIALSASNFSGTATATLTLSITKAPAAVALGSLSATYNGSPHAITVATTPSGLAVGVTYDGSATAPTNAGSYNAVASVSDANYAGSASATFVIAKATQSIEFPNPGAKIYGDTPFALGASASSGLPVSYSLVSGPAILVGSTVTLTGAGNVTLRAAQSGSANYLAAPAVDATFAVAPSDSPIALANLQHYYDGAPKSATATTTPVGLNVTFTYNGSATPPTLPGSYAVAATVDDSNYQGTATGTLHITTTVLVRHAPTLNSDIDGSVQVLLAENITLNGNAGISGDLLVPGTPAVQLNGNPTFGGVHDATGSASPANHTVTLNGNSLLRFLVRRVDPLAMPVVNPPATPAGTLNVTLNNASQSPGDFAPLRNLTLNGNVGQIAVPPGTYGSFAANGNSGFTLGVAGSATPTVYHLQSLTLNGNSQLQVVGPVTLVLGSQLNANGSIGSATQPDWLTLEIYSGGLALNGNVNVRARVVAPSGTVTLNGNSELIGSVAADRLVLNGNSSLRQETP